MQQMNINRKGPQTDIPQNVGSKEGLSAKIYQLDTLKYIKMYLEIWNPLTEILATLEVALSEICGQNQESGKKWNDSGLLYRVAK